MIINKQYEKIRADIINEEYINFKHKSGLTVLMCPMEEYTSMYAQFTTRYGSLDTSFKTSDQKDFIDVPEGIAHFLEHKMFEDEDGDAFMKFAETGASANAFTSFERTTYEVLCTDSFMENLEILIKMVTTPYFTKESVEKEQGIIEQEINMYRDNPGWRVYFNVLSAMYHVHPITIDIAGTCESIKQIDSELLFSCYNTFYDLNNMVLSISGRFDPDDVINLCDKLLPDNRENNAHEIIRKNIDEPEAIKQNYIEESLQVSKPLFQIGFKNKPLSIEEERTKSIANAILLEIMCGESSDLYTRLYDTGIITDSLDYEILIEKDLFAIIFSGEADDPNQVMKELIDEIDLFKKNGINVEDFERAKKFYYGRFMMSMGGVESMTSALTNSFVENRVPFKNIEIIQNISINEIENVLNTNYNTDNVVLSVVNPID